VIRDDCFIARTLATRKGLSDGLLDCDGVWDRHHLIRKNRLRQELASEVAQLAVEDDRNLVTTCRRHHELVERALVRLHRDELPDQIEAFATDFRLEGWLDRYYPRRTP
jgi:hypothetical protein